MSDALPPLTALRAFEAAARNLSFAKAANELNVTPAALSFQIKSIEAHLGHPLFRRLNRAVELTEAGRALLPGTTQGFSELKSAWSSARRVNDHATLTVTAGPAFTAKWLAPRLYAFAQAHPEIELRFSASLRVMDFERDEIDVALRFGYGPDPGLWSVPVIAERITPMMTPKLAETIKNPADLIDAPILHDDSVAFLDPPCDWNAWFQTAGLSTQPPTGLRFSQADHAIDAALSGAGVILGRTSLAAKELRNGLLVAPFDLSLETEAHFRFLCREGSEDRPQIKAFRQWLLAEVENCQFLPKVSPTIVSDGAAK